MILSMRKRLSEESNDDGTKHWHFYNDEQRLVEHFLLMNMTLVTASLLG